MTRAVGRWMVVGALVCSGPAAAEEQSTSFPSRLDQYLTGTARLSRDDRQRLLSGEPVTKLLPSDESKEVAVLGAVWVNAPTARYVEAFTDIETFQRGGGFRVTKKIGIPPKLEDFADMKIPDEDLDDLRTCRVGDCEIKLSEGALKRFNEEIDWSAPDARRNANALMQRLAFEYVSRYLEGGNAELAVYRDKSRPRFVAEEFRSMVERMPGLTTYMPQMRRYLLEYPRVTIPGATSFLYWQETEFGLKPTIRISHVTIRERADATVVASKMLYASHYFWTGLELQVLLPDADRGPGFWYISVSRSRSDGLSGFTGMFVRGRVRSGTESGTMAALRAIKGRLEASR